LGLIVITHQHMDHFGLVDILARRSGAEVAAPDLLAPWLATFTESMEADDAYAEQIMATHGVPADARSVLRAVAATFHGWGAPARVTVPLADGAQLRLRDRTLTVSHRPGHSPSDTVLHDQWAKRRRHTGVLDDLRGARPCRPVAERRARARGIRRGRRGAISGDVTRIGHGAVERR
jgi:hypothetical protein